MRKGTYGEGTFSNEFLSYLWTNATARQCQIMAVKIPKQIYALTYKERITKQQIVTKAKCLFLFIVQSLQIGFIK